MKLSAKLKQFYLVGSELPLKNHKIKVALNPLDRIFLNFAESLILPF